jgi:hypothetical protein
MPRSRQILRARKSWTSRWRGTVEGDPVAGFQYTEWLPRATTHSRERVGGEPDRGASCFARSHAHSYGFALGLFGVLSRRNGTVRFHNQLDSFVEITPELAERAALGISAGQLLNCSDLPPGPFLDYRCELTIRSFHYLGSTIFMMARIHSGMLPCFLRGLLSRLFSRERSAVISLARVSAGSITASM